ncbi:hypothetical protein GCM10028791_10770 [Echinicola sediminis]
MAIPSMGGIGIVLGIAAGLLFVMDSQGWGEAGFLILGVGIMFLFGFGDDLFELTPIQKMIGQIIAVLMVVFLGDIRVSSFYGFLGIEELPLWFSYAVTVFTLIGLTNAFNMIDGLDGLAGLLSLISFLFLGGWFLATGFTVYGGIALAASGGILSFLVYNWHPAKIFMGDTGSLTLGFLMAVLSVFFVEANGTLLSETHDLRFHAPITAGLALVLVSCFDTLRVIVKRIRRGQSPMAADKTHVHHFLMRMNFRHDQVACILGGIKLAFLGLVIGFSNFTDNLLLPIVIGTVVVLCLVLDAVTLKKVKKIAKASPRVLVLQTTDGGKSSLREQRLDEEPA